jgi:DNA-binding CsgD family transcriptional regulator
MITALTQRETEILRLLNVRLSTGEIAEVLNISSGTVKRHTSRIYRKLGIRSQS